MLTISIETYFLSVDFVIFILWSSNHIAARQSSEALWHRSWLPAISLPPMQPWRLGLGHQHHNGLISWTYEASVDTHFQGEDPIPWKTGKWCFKHDGFRAFFFGRSVRSVWKERCGLRMVLVKGIVRVWFMMQCLLGHRESGSAKDARFQSIKRMYHHKMESFGLMNPYCHNLPNVDTQVILGRFFI